jgi:hypothetical protein
MKTTNYYETFIEVAEDCPVTEAEIPSMKNGEKTVAFLHYELIANNPYIYTSDDVIFNTYAQRNGILPQKLDAEREKFFSKGQPCLRSSPLTKRYGWGVHSNKGGKVAIYPVGSKEYQKYSANGSIRHLKGMRSKRK